MTTAVRAVMRLGRDFLSTVPDWSPDMPVGEIISELEKLPGVTHAYAVGRWQSANAEPIPSRDTVMEEDRGLLFLDVYYTTESGEKLDICDYCGMLIVRGQVCKLCAGERRGVEYITA